MPQNIVNLCTDCFAFLKSSARVTIDHSQWVHSCVESIHPWILWCKTVWWSVSVTSTQPLQVVGTIKGHFKMLIILSLVNMPQMIQNMRERAIGTMSAGMSVMAIAAHFHISQSTISCWRTCFTETGSTVNRTHAPTCGDHSRSGSSREHLCDNTWTAS